MEIIIVVLLSVGVGVVAGMGIATWRTHARDLRLRDIPLLGVVFPPEKTK